MLDDTIQNRVSRRTWHPGFFCTIAVMRYMGAHIKQHSVNSGISRTKNLQPVTGLTLFVTCAYSCNSVLFTSLWNFLWEHAWKGTT